jgi:hypothetical protein
MSRAWPKTQASHPNTRMLQPQSQEAESKKPITPFQMGGFFYFEESNGIIFTVRVNPMQLFLAP